MKPRKRAIISDCIENGIQLGWARAHKNYDNPTPGQIQSAIRIAAMQLIEGYFDFEDSANSSKD